MFAVMTIQDMEHLRVRYVIAGLFPFLFCFILFVWWLFFVSK